MASTEHAGAQFGGVMDQWSQEAASKKAMKDNHDEIWKDHNGPAQDGHAYTGASVIYRNENNGHEHVGWSGELRGTWGAKTDKEDPALGLLRSAGPTKVGGENYHPWYALLHAPHPDPDLRGVNVARSVFLHRDGARELRDREQGRQMQNRPS